MVERKKAALPGFRPVPRTGVIYVMTEAARHGYKQGSSDWANLGQGAPETGPLVDAPDRLHSVQMKDHDFEYAPIDGLPELRDAVADLYNRRYRGGHKSKYTRENVAISPGGRSALTRFASILGRVNVGHFLPDYTAYEELLDTFGTFVPIPIMRSAERGYKFSAAELRDEILGRGLSTVILSNPCNPTGTVISGEALKGWVDVARELSCTVAFDEFYSHYFYSGDSKKENGGQGPICSAASYVQDVDQDPIIIIDGLTKNWRYPGFRVSWTLGPRTIIEGLASAGSFLEGGCSRPMQLAALRLISQEQADREARAIQRSFTEKRDLLLAGLRKLGILVEPAPEGAFYCWANLEKLPPPLNTGTGLFTAALKHGLIIVPGVFFDINPGQRRPDRPSRFSHYARFSFGPEIVELKRGIEKLGEVIAAGT